MSAIDEARHMGNSVLQQLSDHTTKLDEIAQGVKRSATLLSRGKYDDCQILWQRFIINAATPKWEAGGSQQLFVIPNGSIYQLVHWAFAAPSGDQPVLMLNEQQQVIDVPDGVASVMGHSNPRELLLPSNSVLLAANQNHEAITTIMTLFKVYRA